MHRLIFLLTFSTLGADAGVLPLHGSSELVYPQLLEERAANGELMLHITDDLVLTLRKSSVAAPLLRLITTENGKEVTNFLDGKAIESTIYHDVTKMASVSITQAGSGIEVEGLISPKKRIEPAREQARLATGLIPHVIYAIDSGGVHDSVIYNHKMSAPDPVTARSISGTETVPKKVTVEIFVISDTHHSQFFHNKTKLTVYVCLIINVANIRLSDTSDPTIQLLFTGIEVSKNEPYLNDKGYMLNAETTIQALGRYAFHVKQRLGYPDTLYLFTGRDAYGQRWGRSDRGLRGWEHHTMDSPLTPGILGGQVQSIVRSITATSWETRRGVASATTTLSAVFNKSGTLSGADAGTLPSHERLELVYPQLLEERTANGELMLHVTDDLVLNLRKSSVAAPLVRLITTENGKEVTHILDGKTIESTIYHDAKKMASVSVTQLGTGIEVEGLISPERRIEPAREQARLATGLIPHVIHVIDSGGVHDSVIYDHKISAPDPITARSSSGTERVPDRVTVEMFVISDTYHSRFYRNKTKLTVYVCLIINVVNIRLSATRDPTIQLLFTGIELSVNEPYLNDKGDTFSAETTIQALGRYAFHVRERLGNPDTLYLLTGRDAYGIRYGRADRGLRGLGYDNGICTDWFVALGEDVPGTFSGADTFAHEVAHLLGASHDGQPPDPRYPGRPGAQNCPFHYGYLMGNAKLSHVGHHYSPCSLQQMRYIVSLRGSSCWRVTATKTYNVTKKYPGMILTMKAYCQRKFSTKKDVIASDHFKAQCKVRCLYNEVYETPSNGHRHFKDVEALEYTPCGDKQVCIQGACVLNPKKGKKKRP